MYGIADIDLTRLQRVQNQLARLVTKSPPFTRSLPLLRSIHWLPVRFRILFKINLLTYKTLHEKQPAYLHSMIAAQLPSCSLRSNNDNRSVPKVKTNTGARDFHSCARLFGTTSHCLSFQPFQLLPLRKIWRNISFTWPFPHRYSHAPWPVDVTELFPQFCCWTMIRLSHHWAWLRRGYWRCRGLIDWLIDKRKLLCWLARQPTYSDLSEDLCLHWHSFTLMGNGSKFLGVQILNIKPGTSCLRVPKWES